MKRGKISRSFNENRAALQRSISTETHRKVKSHLEAVDAVAEAFATFPIMNSQAFSLFKSVKCKSFRSGKGGSLRKMSSEVYEMLARHLNITQIYINGTAFVIQECGTKFGRMSPSPGENVSNKKLIQKI